jgi:DNA-damage-inducible protein D
MNDQHKDSAKLAGMAFHEALERLANTEPREVALVTNASMKDGAIEKLVAAFEDAARRDDDGIEFWTARDLARLLEYADYRNFLNIIEKAKISCKNSGQNISDHFVDATDMIEIGKGAVREVDDIHLTRYAAYLTAQNADPRKPPVAFAQTYFAIQTRRQEILDEETAQYVPLSEDQKRVLLREEIKTHNRNLASAAKGAGVIEPIDYAIFQTHGYKGLYGGLDRAGIQRRKGLRAKQPILDHMGSTELAANLFRATQTEEKLRRDNVKGKDAANATHYDVGRTVRRAIREIGGTMPENLPPAEDVSKIARRLKKGITSPPKKIK